MDVKEYINVVKDLAFRDCVVIANLHGSTPEAAKTCHDGTFGVPYRIFQIIDFLGKLVFHYYPEKDKIPFGYDVNQIQSFISVYFPRHYQFNSKLLVALWFHNQHLLVPRAVCYSEFHDKKLLVGWSSNNSNKQEEKKLHMKIVKHKKNNKLYCLNINICQFADDLIQAIDYLLMKLDDCEHDHFKNECQKNLDILLESSNVNIFADKQKQALANKIMNVALGFSNIPV
jgi:hypothetical protein